MNYEETDIDINVIPKITRSVVKQIQRTIGNQAAESGGILVADSRGVIDHFHFDAAANRSRVTYSPATETFGPLLRGLVRDGLRVCGVVHSHPPNYTSLSGGDLVMAEKFFTHNPTLRTLHLPIVQTIPDTGNFTMNFWRIDRPAGDRRIIPRQVPYEVISDDERLVDGNVELDGDPFARVRECLDIDRMHQCHVMVAGCGGSADSLGDLARMGVGKITLIDPDVVSVANLATQGYCRRDVGRLKVHVLANRLHDIYPQMTIQCFAHRSDDLPDGAFGRLLAGNGPTLLAAYTDSFHAQASLARISLKFGVPLIAAQVWPNGDAAEIVFTSPGITQSCHRCVLWSRYEAQRRRTIAAASAGTPISTTGLLNANKTLLTIGLLHTGADHPRFGRMIADLGSRNFIVIKATPSCHEKPFRETEFTRPKHFDWTGAVSLEMPPHADCPDCRGHGASNEPAGWIAESQAIFP